MNHGHQNGKTGQDAYPFEESIYNLRVYGPPVARGFRSYKHSLQRDSLAFFSEKYIYYGLGVGSGYPEGLTSTFQWAKLW